MGKVWVNKKQIKKIITKKDCCIVWLISDECLVCDLDFIEDYNSFTFILKAKRGE